MSKVKTEVIFSNPEDIQNSGYVIKNPYATKQTFNTEDGRVEIPVYDLIRIFAMLYTGENTKRDTPFLRSTAVKVLNKYFSCKHNYKTWREKLRPLKESEYYNR
tara:strand:+ start:771 stop:1082 length:312 start_codon:yes stop_codon:yes gene_type:complete